MKRFAVSVGVILAVSAICTAEPALQVTKMTAPEILDPGQTFSGSVVLNPAQRDRMVTVQWRDTYNRVGTQATYDLPAGQDRLDYTLVLTDPISRRGRVEAVVDGAMQVEHVKVDVLMPPPAWDDYVAFTWAHYPHGYYELLRDYGITGAMLYRSNNGDQYADNNFPVYIDQMGWEIFAFYHKRRAIWDQTIDAYGKNPREWSLTFRRPCISDERSYTKIRELYSDMVTKQRIHRPYFYNLADEIGFGDQSGANDFCWDYASRDRFRDFLKERYGHSVARLNQQWGTDFQSWAQVRSVHPSTYSVYDKLHRDIYLPRDFGSPDSAAFAKTFGSSFPSFDKAIALYAALRTSDPVGLAYVTANLGKDVAPVNDTYGCTFATLEQIVAFYNAYDAWSFSLTVDPDNAEAMKGWNLSAWVDFRECMDLEMAKGIGRARSIGKEYDADGRFGFTGTHHPGVFSGHNYAKLCPVVDIIVPYNIGGTPEIIRSLNPDTCIQILPTWKTGDIGVRDLWTRVLHGDRGVIFWDNEELKHRFIVQPTKQPTERATTQGPTLVELETGLGKQLIASRRENNGIAIYYSHPSNRVDFFRQNLGKGRQWVEMRSWNLYKPSLRNILRVGWYNVIEDMNLQYDAVSAEQVADGRLLRDGYKVLIMPQVMAMSKTEADAVRAFVAAGGTVIADRYAGIMDQHGKWLDTPQLADLWANPNAHLLNTGYESYKALRMQPGKEKTLAEPVAKILAGVGITPAVRVLSTTTSQPLPGTEVHVFNAGPGVRVAGITRNINLGQVGIGGIEKADNSIFEKTESVKLVFDKPVYVVDQRAGKSLGKLESLAMDLDAWSPPILVLSDEPLKSVTANASITDGVVTVDLTSDEANVARVIRVDVRGPSGEVLRHYGSNALVTNGSGQLSIRLAVSDPAGDYAITCRDILTGKTTELKVNHAPGA